MTITVVPSVPTHTELQAYDVNNPIAGRHMGEMINNTSFLLGKNVANVVCSFPAVAQLADDTSVGEGSLDHQYHSAVYEWYYTRSPDVRYVFLETECWKSTYQALDTVAYDVKITTTLPGGATWADTDSSLALVNNTIPDDWSGNIDFVSSRRGVIDVSGLSTTVPSLFKITATGIAGTTVGSLLFYRPGGISKIIMQEIPQRFLVISQTGQSGSSDIISTVPLRRIVDGSATTEYGLARMLDQTKKAKTRVRNQWQIINHQSTIPIINPDPLSGLAANQTTIWYSNSLSLAPLRFQIPGENRAGNVFYIRTRNYDGASGTNKYTLYVRYRTALALPATGISLTMDFISEPSGLSGASTVSLPASTGWSTASTEVSLPCDKWIFQREQLVRLNFTVAGAGAGQTLYVSALYLVENEVG